MLQTQWMPCEWGVGTGAPPPTAQLSSCGNLLQNCPAVYLGAGGGVGGGREHRVLGCTHLQRSFYLPKLGARREKEQTWFKHNRPLLVWLHSVNCLHLLSALGPLTRWLLFKKNNFHWRPSLYLLMRQNSSRTLDESWHIWTKWKGFSQLKRSHRIPKVTIVLSHWIFSS